MEQLLTSIQSQPFIIIACIGIFVATMVHKFIIKPAMKLAFIAGGLALAYVVYLNFLQ